MRISIVLLATLVSGVAYAADPSDLIKCSAISDSLKRLDCFDSLAAASQAAADLTALKKLGAVSNRENWTVSVKQSKIDDSTTVILLWTYK